MPEREAIPRKNFGEDRTNSVIVKTPATFDIADNAKADGGEPPYARHKIGREQVFQFSDIVEEEARAQGVDPNLVRAIMYVENAQGHYFGLSAWLERHDRAGSLFPMNIRPDPWKGLGYSEADFKDPRLNIRAAVTLLKRIIERVENPTVAKIASLYNNLRTEYVTDYGARVAEVYKGRTWLDPNPQMRGKRRLPPSDKPWESLPNEMR